MVKKKIIAIIDTLVVATFVCLSFSLNPITKAVRGEEHGSTCKWNHYDAVEAKTGKHGSKEFWACCIHETFSLEEPSSGTITDCGQFSGQYFDTLNPSDARYVPKLGSVPIVEENIVKYGVYPQTNINDESLISSLNALETPELNGWYLYEDEYYANVSAAPYSTTYVFNNGTTIVKGTTYWFKCDVISWNILNINSGKYFLVSSVLLDAQCYAQAAGTHNGSYYYENYYNTIDVRAWLNGDFYNTAFSLGNTYIQTTTVNNSCSTTDDPTNAYECSNTKDKVFMLSYQDYVNVNYGFTASTDSSETRYCSTTDWARARGAYSTSSSRKNGYYWTRSPYSKYSYYASYVSTDGSLNGRLVKAIYCCPRPCLNLSIV